MSIYGVVYGWINANFARRIAFSKEKACVVHLKICDTGRTTITTLFQYFNLCLSIRMDRL
jgi:hypothetical protein